MVEDIIKILDKAVLYNIKVYDMREKTPFYDYSIVCSASSSRQGAAAVEYLKSDAVTLGLDLLSVNGKEDSTWFLVDLNEVIVHIFVGDERTKYGVDTIYAN